ncbi:MAG: ABC transporter substrate-binding protein [Firmicutes bacterium]|nr:ABC transporter substrate-binding protein [Bacillota bacterium]MDD3298421.1 ABC transporter substrate-binding protein [Bacillota bacterium]MDD4707417.1 ABC transporter substrate-binding protein [Bacillota bacterium]
MKFLLREKSIVLTVTLIVLVAVIASGCGGSSTGQNDTGEEQPKIAFYAFNSEPILDWDPSVEYSNGIVVLNNVYETLLRYNPISNEVIPLLAAEYSKSDDGLTWTFKLRQGVKFHDGTDLKAEDVKASIDRTIALGQGAAFIWDAVEEIVVKDDYTIDFELNYPAPLDLIASSGYAAFIMSAEAIESNPDDWFSQGNEAGTGPYMLQSFKMGDEVVMTKFDDYWKGWDGEHFDKVVIKKIPETASRRQLVEKGEADVTMELPYEDIEALKGNSAVNIIDEPSFQNLLVFFNTEKAPLDNKLVRQVLCYAFPYGDVVKYAMGGYATQGRGPIPAGHWGHGKDLFQHEYDLDKAKELLAQAGYPDGGLDLLFTYMAGDEAEKKSAELYKTELSKIGINLEIRGMPWESQWELARDSDPEKRQDILTMYWWPDYASPYSWLYSLYHSEEEILFNLAYWKNARFDQLIDEGNEKSGIDRQVAEDLYIQAQEILIEETPSLFAYDKRYVWVTNSSFKGFESNPIYPNVVFFYDTYHE